MNKDFNEQKLLSFNEDKIFRVLFELAHFIELNKHDETSSHFEKLKRYHTYLASHTNELIKKLNAEFAKVNKTDSYQFEIYLMNLERFLDMSSSEYDFLVTHHDHKSQAQSFNIICILDSIRSAHNIGSMLRNAECFGIQKITLTGLSPRIDHPQVKKTSMGCEDFIEWEYEKDINKVIKKYQELGYKIWGIETSTQSVSLSEISEVPEKLALIFGHEVYGVNPKILNMCDKIIRIDLSGRKNSLNVAVSQAITLNHITQLLRVKS